jgi:hypothetical protein
MAHVDPGGNPSIPGSPNDSWQETTCPGIPTDSCDLTAFTVFLGRDGTGAEDRSGPCARVTILKARGSSSGGVFTPGSTGPNLQTTVDSRGYNYCDEDNTRRVERGLRFTY